LLYLVQHDRKSPWATFAGKKPSDDVISKNKDWSRAFLLLWLSLYGSGLVFGHSCGVVSHGSCSRGRSKFQVSQKERVLRFMHQVYQAASFTLTSKYIKWQV